MLVRVFAIHARVSPDESETLHGISRAFADALDKESHPIVIAMGAALAIGVAYLIMRWLREEAEREEELQRDLEERRAALARDPARVERRTLVRVPARLPMTILRTSTSATHQERVETHNLAAEGVAFHTNRPPPPGEKIDFTLDLGERIGLPLQGEVVRVEAPRSEDGPSLVAVHLKQLDNATREHLMRWIAAAEMRRNAESRRGRLCGRCKRPVASGMEMHPTCAEKEAREAREAQEAREAKEARAAKDAQAREMRVTQNLGRAKKPRGSTPPDKAA